MFSGSNRDCSQKAIKYNRLFCPPLFSNVNDLHYYLHINANLLLLNHANEIAGLSAALEWSAGDHFVSYFFFICPRSPNIWAGQARNAVTVNIRLKGPCAYRARLICSADSEIRGQAGSPLPEQERDSR